VDLDLDSLRKNRIFLGRVAMADLTQIPFKDGSFDLVTANMVVEHLSDPRRVLEEVRRVLRPGGRFLYHTPNRKAPAIRLANRTPETLKKKLVWLLERRQESDIFTTYYRMNTADDVRAIAHQTGLKVEGLLELSSSAITYRLGPLAIPELVFLRLLESERLRHLRTNLIVTLKK
jgi:SAM-dependent methyltransferase